MSDGCRLYYDGRNPSHEIAMAVGIILFASILACAPMLWYGASNGTDSSTALVWVRYFSQQLLDGNLYPRWLMNANRGAGSPAFYFYAPLPYYIASIATFLFPKAALTTQLAWEDWLLLSLSGVSFFVYGRTRFRSGVAVVCSILYMLLPYHYEIDLWTRQDLGELTNYIWMPLALRFAEELMRNGTGEAGFAGCFALMLISHIPSTLLFTLCLVPYAVMQYRRKEFFAKLLKSVRALCVGVLLAAVYWVPAYFSQQYIHAEAWWTWYLDYHIWFFPVRPLEAFRSMPDGRAYNLRIFTLVGITTVAMMLLALASVLAHGVSYIKKLAAYIAMASFAWFLMTPASELVWTTLPFLAKVQFPSRVSMVVDLATAVIALHAVSGLRPTKRSAVVIIAGVAASLIWCIWTADLKAKLGPFSDQSLIALRDEYVNEGVDAPEYTTIWSPFSGDTFDNSAHIGPRARVSYDVQNGMVDIGRWEPGRIELAVDLKTATSLIVKQFYFPSWRAMTEDGIPMPISPSKQDGLISLNLPSGDYRLIVKLVPLPQEVVGALMSLVGIGMLVGVSKQVKGVSKWLKKRDTRRDDSPAT